MSVFQPNRSRPARASGTLTACMLQDRILGLVLTGHLDEAMFRQAMTRVRAVQGVEQARVIVADALQITTLEASMHAAARELVAQLKAYGVSEIYAATSAPAVRMVGVTIGLAAGVGMRFFATLEEARAAAQASLRGRRL